MAKNLEQLLLDQGNITWDTFRSTSMASICYDKRYGTDMSEAMLRNLSYLPNGYNFPFDEISDEDGMACHWTFFEAPSDAMFYLIGTLYSIIGVFGILGNGLVMVIFCRSPLLQTTSNVLIVSLSLSDLILVLKAPVAATNNFLKYPVMGRSGCVAYGVSSIISGLSSIWVLTTITYERYKVITSGYSGINKFSMQTILGLLGIIWSAATLMAILPLLGWNSYVYEGYFTTCTMDSIASSALHQSYTYILLVVAYILPMGVIAYSNLSIVYNNKTNNKEIFEMLNMRRRSFPKSDTLQSFDNTGGTLSSGTGINSSPNSSIRAGTSSNVHVNKFKKDRHMIELRLAKVAFFLILLWVVSWTPYALVFFWSLTSYAQWLHPVYDVFPAVICKMSAATNPYIYGLFLPKFRREFHRLLQRSFSGKKEDIQHNFGQ